MIRVALILHFERWLAVVVLLSALGCGSTEGYIRDLESGKPSRQRAAAERLEAKPDPGALSALRKALLSPDFSVRRACSRAIAKTGDRLAMDDAARVMGLDALSLDTQTVEAAVETLAELGSPGFPELITLATVTTEPVLRVGVKKHLFLGIKNAAPEDRIRAARILVDALKETDPTLYHASYDTLLWVLPGLLPEVMKEGLAHPNLQARRSVIIALGEARQPSAVQPLIGLLQDPEASVREDVARALGKVGSPSARAPLERLVKTDISLSVRRAATEALAQLEEKAKSERRKAE